MKEPFANLDTRTIDEQIEEILHTPSNQHSDEDTRCLQDLHYLYHKDQILDRARKRLSINDSLAPVSNQDRQATPSSAFQQEQNTLVSQPYPPIRRKTSPWSKVAAGLAAAVLLIGALIGTAQFFRAHPQQGVGNKSQQTSATATAAVQASATAQANILFQDPLSQNIHNFPAPNAQQFFKDGAYHLYVPGSKNTIQLVEQQFPEISLSYQITMEEVKGDDNSAINTFGVVLDCSVKNVNALVITTFYTFEILNWNGHYKYSFFKYNSDFDSSKQSTPWTPLGSLNAPGKEFHGGQGPNAINTVRVVDNAGSFTFYVNDQQVGTANDTSLQPGYLGMLVNHTGTEVAYSNMLVTRP